MYSHYRDNEYQKNRQRYEPWYTKKFNNAIGNDPETIELRRENLFLLVNNVVNDKKIDSPKVVVDWGGGQGTVHSKFSKLDQKTCL